MLNPEPQDEIRVPISIDILESKANWGRLDFGPLQLVVVDINAPANVDGYIGYNFFMSHVVCMYPLERIVKIRKNAER